MEEKNNNNKSASVAPGFIIEHLDLFQTIPRTIIHNKWIINSETVKNFIFIFQVKLVFIYQVNKPGSWYNDDKRSIITEDRKELDI